MLKNLKIRSRLLVSYAIVLVLTVIISVTAISKPVSDTHLTLPTLLLG